MELKDVILGFLDWKELTGYELKGLFASLDFLPWSGNNNQIYTALLELEKEGLVEKQVIQQEKTPAQKRYKATAQGLARLKEAVQSGAVQAETKNDFLLHLLWSHCLSKEELTALIDNYQRQVETALAMCREKIKRDKVHMQRSEREAYVFDAVQEHEALLLQTELNWLSKLRNGLANKGG
jgi:DNA-binding PadR family transcriptional regulator